MEYEGYEVWISGTTAAGAKQMDTTVSMYHNRAVNSKPLHEYSMLGESSNDQRYAYGRLWIDAQLAQRAYVHAKNDVGSSE